MSLWKRGDIWHYDFCGVTLNPFRDVPRETVVERLGVGHNGWRAFGGFVQRLCNGFDVAQVCLELLHRQVKPAALDVEISARRAEVGMAEHLTHVIDRHSRFIEARASFMTEIPELKIT